MALSDGLLIGVGNPLLDISAQVGPDLLNKYGLEANGAIMAEERHMPLYKELMDNYDTELIAGGSVQNTVRVTQWVLKRPNVCTFFGCVGDDEYADLLRKSARKEGVNPQYQVTRAAPTGTCAVLLTTINRSLVANLAAAQMFTPNHLDEWESKKCIDQARFIYTSGFFLAVSPESLLILAKNALSRGNKFILNISATFVPEFYKAHLEELLPYTDILFGNDDEAKAFAKAFNLRGSLEDIARAIAAMPKKNSNKRIVIITQSKDPILLVEGPKVQQIPVKLLDQNKIVDTTGAGDSFVGGFLAQLIQGKPLVTCVECAMYAAHYIIQQSGCTFSSESNFVEKGCSCCCTTDARNRN